MYVVIRWYPKKSGDIRQPAQAALTKVHNGTAWHTALLDSFSRTCLDISQDALAGDDSDTSICLRMLHGTWHVLLVVPHTQSSEDTPWKVSSVPGCPDGRQGNPAGDATL